MKKKVLALILTAAMVVGLAACGGSTSNDAASTTDGTTTEASDNQTGDETTDTTEAAASTGEKILSVQVGPDPETIDPALNSAVDGGNMLLHSFECLLAVDENGQLVPGQAESWETSEDGLTWTFHLRDGLKWSDGSDLTANDFVYSWKRVCDPMVAAPYAETVLSMVEGYDKAIEGDLDALQVVAQDDNTLVVTLSTPCSYFGSLAAFATLSPVQEATVTANGDAWATSAATYISNGPFYVSEWVPGSYIMMSKNPYYWNADAIKLDGIKWNLIEDSNAAYSAYQTGEVLMIKNVPTEEIPSLKDSADFHVDPIIGTYYLSLNLERDAFKDARVRKALSLAIDRDYVANTLMQGTYSPADNLMGPGWIDMDGKQFKDNANGGQSYIDVNNYEADLEEAKQLLADAGYPDGEGFPAITYKYPSLQLDSDMAQALQAQWKTNLGIEVELQAEEQQVQVAERRSGDFQLARMRWTADFTDPFTFLSMYRSNDSYNDNKTNCPEYDELMAQSNEESDPTARFELLHQAESVLVNDYCFGVPVLNSSNIYLVSTDITNFEIDPSRNMIRTKYLVLGDSSSES